MKNGVLKLPATVGKYRLMELIGKGATGRVYRALDTFTEEVVAFKLVDKALLEDPQFDEECRRQFVNEAALAGRLNHPHIVRIVEAAVDGDPGYVVMEYVAGGTLVQYTRPNSLLPVEDTLQVLFKCCGALDYAFRQGIIHRDIKPANVMMSSLSEVKIADFGASVFYQSQATSALSVGSPYYMSPEQIRGERLTHLSDMYSLGVLGYELLTGDRPFKSDSFTGLFTAISEVRAAPLSRVRAGLSSDIDDLILKMIAKEPEARFASWADLALEIAALGEFGVVRQQALDSEKFQGLRRLSSFTTLTDAEIWALLSACTWTSTRSHTKIIEEGALVSSLYVLVSGHAKVTRVGRLLNTLSPGEWFGEIAYVDQRRNRQTTIETVSDALVAELPFDRLESLPAALQLKLSKMMLKALADRLDISDQRALNASGVSIAP